MAHKPQVFTQDDAKQRELGVEAYEEEQSSKYTWGEVASKALHTEQIIPLLFEAQGRQELAPDPDFVFDQAFQQRVLEEVPEQYYDWFVPSEIQSEGQYQQRLADVRKVQADHEVLFSKGTATGVTAAITAGLLDPAAIGIAVASEGVLAPFVIANKATRIGKAIQTGLVSAAGSAAVESTIASASQVYDETDALLGTLAGGILGTGLGYAMGRGIDKEALAMRQAIELHEIQQSGLTLSPDGQKVFKNFLNDDGSVKSVEDINKSFFDVHTGHETAFAGVRGDRASDVFSSESTKARSLGAALIEDPVPAKGAVVGETAELFKKRTLGNLSVSYLRGRKKNLEAYRVETGSKWGNLLKSEEEFAEQVTMALRGQPVQSPAVLEQAKIVRQLFDDISDMARNPGKNGGSEIAKPVKGSENMVVENYVPRVWSPSKIAQAMEMYGPDQVYNRIAKAIRGVSEETGKKIAKHLVAVTNRSRNGGLDIQHLSNHMDNLENFLRREHGMSGDEAAQVADSLRRLTGGSDAGNTGNLKHRLDIDEEGLSDLLENNIDLLFQGYANRMTGHIALARQGIDSEDTFKRLLEEAQEEVLTKPAQSLKERDKQQRTLRNLQEAYDHIVGRPTVETNPGGLPNTIARILRKLQVSRLMNMVGTAQIGELGVVVTQAGVKAAFRNVPELAKIRKRMLDGSFSDELLEELQVLTGGFADYRLLQRTNQRIEDFGSPTGQANKSGYGKAERVVDRMSEVTMDISGFNFINQALQAWAGKSLAQNFLDAARKGGKHRLPEARLRELGIDEEALKGIKREMMKKGGAKWTRNGTLTRLNLENWDPVVLNKFANAMARQGRIAVQEGSFGGGIRWTESVVGKILMEFKSFMMGAWTIQVLNNVKHADRVSFLQLQNTILAGSLSYMVYTAITAQGRADKERYLDRMLSMERIAAGAFQRSSISSFFPGMIDSGVMLLGMDPMFDMRASGLASGGLMSNPTVDYLEKFYEAASGTSKTLRNGEVTQDTLRGVLSILPFQNAIGIRNAANVAYGELPRSYDY